MDPYSEWLGIPADQQPPHHYRLFALPAFEANTEAIRAAGQRVIRRVEAHREEEPQLADHLKQEIQAALKCLLDAQRKADYDLKLRDGLAKGTLPGRFKQVSPPTGRHKSPTADKSKGTNARPVDSAGNKSGDDPMSHALDDLDLVPMEDLDRPKEPSPREHKAATAESDPDLHDDTMPVFEELEDFVSPADLGDVDSLLDELMSKPEAAEAPRRKPTRTPQKKQSRHPTPSNRQKPSSNRDKGQPKDQQYDQQADHTRELAADTLDPLLALLPDAPGYDVLPIDDDPGVALAASTPEADEIADALAQPTFETGSRQRKPQRPESGTQRRTARVMASAESPLAEEAANTGRRPRVTWIKAGLLGGGLIVASAVLAVSFLWRPSPQTSEAPVAGKPRPRSNPQDRPKDSPSPSEISGQSPEASKPQPPRHTAVPRGKPVFEADQPMAIQDSGQALATGDAWWNLGQQRRGRERDFLLLRTRYWYTQAQNSGLSDSSKGKVAERLAATTGIDDPRVDVDGGPWGEALKWPIVFHDPLHDVAAIDKFNAFPGLGSSDVYIDKGRGVRIAGGQSATALWLKPPVGSCCELSLQFMLSDQGSMGLWLSGPGQGNSMQMGYFLLVGETRVDLLRRGALVSSVRFRPHLERNSEHQVTVLRDGNRFLVWIDRTLTICYEDPSPLGPPLHCRLGVGAVGGQRDAGVRLANLVLRHPSLSEDDRRRLAVVRLSPIPTQSPAPNGELLFDIPAGETVGEGWYQSQPDFSLPIRRDKLLMSGPSGMPLVLRRTPVDGDFAFEITFLYQEPRFPRSAWKSDRSHQDNYLQLGGEALNLHLLAYFESQLPGPARFESFTPDVAAGWEVALPNGDGNHTISWAAGQRRQILAQVPYYAPVPNQEYVARLERRRDAVRVFLNGSLLLEARQPTGSDASSGRTLVGFRQLFGGSIVRRVAAWRIDADPSIALDATSP